MANSPDLGVPYVPSPPPAQAEVLHNEALNMLIALQKGAIDRGLNTPPGSPTDGDVYIVGTAPTGAWAGKANKIAIRTSTAWTFVPGNDSDGADIPIGARHEGLALWVQDEDAFYVWSGSAWTIQAPPTEASASEIWGGSSTTKFVSPSKALAAGVPAALTSAASITPDGANGFNFTLTLAEDATLENPSNFGVGRSGVIEITQDGTGGWTLAYGSNWRFPGGAPVLSTGPGAIDLLAYFVVASGRILATLTKAYST